VGKDPDRYAFICNVIDLYIFAFVLHSTSGALQWTARHFDLLHLPIDLWVVIVEPVVT
jgi:hypothetical protein